MSSKQFSSQIRQLEEEGAKLLAATHSLGDSLHLEDDSRHLNHSFKASTKGISTPQITALADITEEQKTIDHLRKNLDEQCVETQRLHKEMFNTSLPAYRTPQLSSTLTNLEIPISSSTPSAYNFGQNLGSVSASSSPRKHMDFTSTTHVITQAQQLRQAQNELSEQRGRLKEAISISEQQKTHFRETIEDLRGQLHRAMSDRDSLAQKSKREAGDKDVHIAKLLETLEQLERANKVQEDTIVDFSQKLDSYQKDEYIIETAISQIRGILQEREHRRRRPFYDSEPIKKQSITVLVHTLEKCLQDLDCEVMQKQEKIDQCLLEIDDVKVSSERKLDHMKLEQERKQTKLQDEQEREYLKLTEQYHSYKDETTLLQDKLNKTENKMEHHLKISGDQANDLEARLYNLRKEHDMEKREWTDRKSSLEMALDESQKEAALAKGEKDAQIRLSAQLESRYTDLQSLFDRINLELTEERERNKKAQENDISTKEAQERLQLQLKHKDQVLNELEQKMKVVKHEADTQIASAISSMEKEGRAYIEREIISLKTQVEALTDKCHKVQLELEVTKSENKNLQERYKEAKDNLDKATSQLEQASSKKESIVAALSAKENDVERVTHEKDYYFKLIDERNQEISTLKSIKEKLTIQMEEREKNFLALQQQNDKMTDFMNENTKGSSELRSDRDHLQQQFNEKVIETEELRKSRDQLIKRIKMKDKKLQDLEAENTRMTEEIGGKRTELGVTEREKDKVYDELKQSRYEVTKLEEDHVALQKQLKEKEEDLSRELARLNKRLNATEHEFKLTRKTLKTREEVDGKAVKVAGRMQKEVTEKRGQIDTLQTRIHWLEECLDAAIKDKSIFQGENEKLTSTIFKLGKQSDRISQDLQNNLTKNKTMRVTVVKLEGALEKAAIKNSTTQADLEKQQQEIARLQLKHQLQLKEVSRNGEIKQFYNPVEQSKSHTLEAGSTTESTKPFTAPRSTKTLDLEEKPVRDRPKQSKASAESTSEDGVGHELRHILDEMRTLIQGQQHRTLSTKYQSNDSTVFSDSDIQPVHIRKSSKGIKDKHKKQRSYGGKTSMKNFAEPDFDTVSALLLPSSSHVDGVMSGKSVVPKKLQTDSQDVCKRLEKKIQSLSKMGNQLQHDNKEIAKVMKDQDKKLKKVRSQIVK